MVRRDGGVADVAAVFYLSAAIEEDSSACDVSAS